MQIFPIIVGLNDVLEVNGQFFFEEVVFPISLLYYSLRVISLIKKTRLFTADLTMTCLLTQTRRFLISQLMFSKRGITESLDWALNV